MATEHRLTEEQFLELANRVRRVQTPEGAKFYGLPIGAIITADLYKKKQAEAASKGVTPPDGSSVGSPSNAVTNPSTSKPATAPTAMPGSGVDGGPNLVSPTITGSQGFSVGDAKYSAPMGSRLFLSKQKKNVAYVLTPDGKIHVFNPSGEVVVEDYLQDVLADKFSKFKGEDPNFKESHFDSLQAKGSLSDQKPGAVLKKGGKPAFTKTDEASWTNDLLGVTLTDDDLQKPFDMGVFELTPATVEEVDFSQMSQDEIEAALESFPEGHQLGLGSITLTKQADGTWKSSATGVGSDAETIASIAVGTSFLSDKLPSPPGPPKPKAAKKSSAKGEERIDPLQDPERELNEANAQKKLAQENLASGGDILEAPVGTEFFHDTVGSVRKIDEDTWERLDTGAKFAQQTIVESAGFGYISKVSWTPEEPEDETPEPDETPDVPNQDDLVDDEEYDGYTGGVPDSIDPDDAIIVGETYVTGDQYAALLEDLDNNKPINAIKKLRDFHFENTGETLSLYQAKKDIEVLRDEIGETEGALYEGTTDVPENAPEDTKTSDGMPVGKFTVSPKVYAQIQSMLSDNLKITAISTLRIHVADTTGVTLSTAEAKEAIERLIQENEAIEKALVTPDAPETDDADWGDNKYNVPVADMKAAIESLEDHSGFQIKYGLKALPDNNIIKADPDTLDKMVADAKEKYPTISPKQALLKHLKSLTNDDKDAEPLAPWEKELLDGPYIQIGAETSKMTATGVTGGSYSKADIQNAIDLLEGFDGKAFKAYLNKNGNPLGELSPNDIVGFNKDKTITKNNFLDLLKKKVATPDESATPETSTPGEGDEYPLEAKDVFDFPIGSIIEEEDSDGATFVKVSEDAWADEEYGAYIDPTLFYGSKFKLVEEGTGEPETLDESIEEDSPVDDQDMLPENPLAGIDPASLSSKNVKDLPPGTEAFWKGSNGKKDTYTKGYLSWKNDQGLTWTNDEMWKSFGGDSGWSFTDPDVSDESDSSADAPEAVDSAPVEDTNKPKMENGHILIDSVFAHKIGGQAGSNEGGLYNLTTDNGVEKFYVKKAQTKDHGNNEALANALYARLGVKAPEVDHASDGNLYSKIVDGEQDMADRLNDPEWREKVQRDFAIDAWLSNRDVFGLTYDNILTDDMGNPWRIDNGGALKYRAMGEQKTDFGPDVTELDIFKTGKKAKVFGPNVMSTEAELDGVKRLAKFSPDSIREMVKDHGMDDELAETLVKRRAYILNRYNVTDIFAPLEAPEDKTLSKGDSLESQTQLDSMPVGTTIQFHVTGTIAKPIGLKKNETGTWTTEDGGDIKPNFNALKQFLTFQSYPTNDATPEVSTPEPESTSEVAEPVNGIAPGKYNTGKGAKASLWVKPDGTGVYQGMKGILKPLDADGVKKNYDAGMSNLVDTPPLSSYPDGDDAVAETATKAKTIPNLGSVDSLPDGVYQWKDTTYTVKGDTVESSTPAKTAEGTDIAVGKKPDNAFKSAAPVGTVVAFRWGAKDLPDFLTKQEDGSWKGPSYVENYWNYLESGYGQYFKVHSFPQGDTSTVSKASLKTKYLKGQLIDPETKTSVYPPGHSGDLTFMGGATNVSSMHDYLQAMKDPDTTPHAKNNLHLKLGVPLNPALFSKVAFEKAGLTPGEATNDQKADAYVAYLESYLALANVPELETKPVLNKDAEGFYSPPEEFWGLDAPAYYESTGAWTNYAKAIAATVGDGTIVGQNITQMSKANKEYWVNHIKKGNFAAAYEIEVNAAASKGKGHPTGKAHPGHPSNTDTHQIKWGSPVPGEIPAGTPIEGNWSHNVNQASVPELDNFLIQAKMQNPEYLSVSEKRQWVNNHKYGNTDAAYTLSLRAKRRKDTGEEPLSGPVVWTDDIQPAKSYDSMFDNGAYPQNWDNSYSVKDATLAFWEDNADKIEGLNELLTQKQSEYSYSYEWQQKGMALNAHFAKLEADYLEELNKPVYKVTRTISTGAHATFIVSDQFDRKKIFKPLTPGKEWRTDTEALAHEFAASLGFNVPSAKIGDVFEGLPMGTNYQGILMDFAPNVGSFGDVDGSPVDIASLNTKQLSELASEHVLDWFLDNDDTHWENILVGESGEVIAIDKGRAFLQYGHWSGLDVDNPDALNINTKDSGESTVVYHEMITRIKSGDLSEEQIVAAYNGAMKSAKRLNKTSDARVEQFVRDATANRNNWDVPDYAQDWPTLIDTPTSQDELVAAVLARKASIVDDIDEMWGKLFSAAGYSKPEKPAKLVDESVFSGWEEADFLPTVDQNKVWGVGTLHASGAFADGASHVWTEQDADGNTLYTGQFTLGSLAQGDVVDFLKTKVKDSSYQSPQAELINFPTDQVKVWKKTATKAGKDASNNATTGQYDQDIWADVDNAQKAMEDELDTIADNIGKPPTDYVLLPSGMEIPVATLPQYQLALEHNLNLLQKAKSAKDNKVATDKNEFKDFVPAKWKKSGQTWTNPATGESYKELYNSGWMHVSGGTAKTVTNLPSDVTKDNGWESSDKEDSSLAADPVKYTKSQAGQYAGTLEEGGIKKIGSYYSDDGHMGTEVRIDLPTGEAIFFRNESYTGTYKSQQGRVRFSLAKGADPAASLSNIDSYIRDKWNINTDGADELSAETVYWRNMFQSVILSNPDKGATPQLVRNVREKLIARRAELSKSFPGKSVEDKNIVEAISRVEADENGYWRSLAMEAYGVDTVNSFLAEEGHLPTYRHMNLANPEQATGMPIFRRIAVSLKDIYDTGALIAIGNSGKDNRHFDYIKAGGMSSTEDRLRMLGVFKQGTSSSADQGTGGAKGVFTRIAKGSALKSGAIFGDHVAYWSPAVMQYTSTYAFPSDEYGNTDNLQSSNPTNPLHALDNYHSHGNETLVRDNLSIYDHLEIMVFEDENKRLKAIEEFKKLGIEKLRGVPIEERLVLRVNLSKAMKTVKAAWSA